MGACAPMTYSQEYSTKAPWMHPQCDVKPYSHMTDPHFGVTIYVYIYENRIQLQWLPSRLSVRMRVK